MRLAFLVLWVLASSGAARADDLILPDLHLTSGSYRLGLSLHKICTIKWGKDSATSRRR